MMAFKLARVGHIDGYAVGVVGEADCLFRRVIVNGRIQSEILSNYFIRRLNPNSSPSHQDLFGTSELAQPHIGTSTFPVGRKFVRCFDLFEHGYFGEAVVIAYAILDDQVQVSIISELEKKGLGPESKRFLRNIKENRLKVLLGPMLKLLFGRSVSEMWSDAEHALSLRK
jgi:hypothetical protein